MWGWILPLLRAFLPWFFSGKKTQEVHHVAGLKDLDRDSLSGKKEMKDFLPKICLMFAALLALGGCATVNLGGAHETIKPIMYEPGSTLEIAEDRPIDVLVKYKDKDGSEQERIAKKKMAGTVAAPKSVYRTLRQFWIDGHPQDAEMKPEPNLK